MPALSATIGVIAILIGRIKESFGIGPASLSFLPALLIYAIAWLGISMLLPRATEDPGALLPGCLLVALTITVMHAVSELYLPDRLDHASQLYGAFGTTVVTLGWFFILGRAIIIAMELNAAIYDRYGSISQAAFSLPVLRGLARRSPRVRRFFDLTDASDLSPSRNPSAHDPATRTWQRLASDGTFSGKQWKQRQGDDSGSRTPRASRAVVTSPTGSAARRR